MNKWGLLGLCISCFVLQSITVELVQSKKEYYKPWFLLYVAHGSYTIFFPILMIYNQLSYEQVVSIINEIKSELPQFGIPLNPIHFWKRILSLTIIFTVTSLFWYFSVSKIPLGDITGIYNCSCFFTYIFSVFMLKERFHVQKLGSVIVSIVGIAFISLWSQDRQVSMTTIVGYTFAILSSIFAASYEVLYSMIAVPKNPSMFFSLYVTGCIGLITLSFGPILFPLFHYTKIEVFQLPPIELWPYIGLVSLLGLGFNSLFLLVITVAGPVFAAVGILVSIPLTCLADYYFMKQPLGWNIALGTLCIFIGFLMLQTNEKEESEPLLP
jgi:drug/metabolite transporter (DMT)-like permease